jgi:hypothetical protein
MIVTVMVVVIMVMVMRFWLRLIGAAFRLEWRLDHCYFGVERRQQVFDFGITAHPDPVRQQLGLDMPIAEVPGDARQRGQVARAGLDQRLRRRYDFDASAILKHQQIVSAQPHPAVQFNIDGLAFGAYDPAFADAALR